MKKIIELLENFSEKSFKKLLDEKKENIRVRASLNEQVLNQIGTLDSLYQQVEIYDSKSQELYEFIKNNETIEVSDIDYDRALKNIQEYNGLISCLEQFKEGNPGINDIFRSSEYISFTNCLRTFTQPNNGNIKIHFLVNEIENILNSLKIKKIELNGSSIDESLITKITSIDFKKIEKADSIATNLLEKKEINQKDEINEHYQYFENKGKTYNGIDKYNFFIIPVGKIWWLLLSVIFGGLTIFYIIFTTYGKTGLSIGDAIIRISVLTIGFYFIVFFSKQFNRYMKLKDFYEDKAVSLKVMIGLSDISSEREKELIYEKALDKIFSELSIDSNNGIRSTDTLKLIKDNFPTRISTNIKE